MVNIILIDFSIISNNFVEYIPWALFLYLLFAHRSILVSIRGSTDKAHYFIGGYLVDKKRSILSKIVILLAYIGVIYVIMILLLSNNPTWVTN